MSFPGFDHSSRTPIWFIDKGPVPQIWAFLVSSLHTFFRLLRFLVFLKSSSSHGSTLLIQLSDSTPHTSYHCLSVRHTSIPHPTLTPPRLARLSIYNFGLFLIPPAVKISYILISKSWHISKHGPSRKFASTAGAQPAIPANQGHCIFTSSSIWSTD